MTGNTCKKLSHEALDLFDTIISDAVTNLSSDAFCIDVMSINARDKAIKYLSFQTRGFVLDSFWGTRDFPS